MMNSADELVLRMADEIRELRSTLKLAHAMMIDAGIKVMYGGDEWKPVDGRCDCPFCDPVQPT
jgi:hypothetical protein